MHALGEERVVVAEGIGRDFAGAGDDAGLLQFLVVLEEEVGREHADAAVDEFLQFGADRAVGQAGGSLAGIVEPDHHLAGGIDRLQPIDRHFFAVGRVDQMALSAEVRVAPLGAGIGEGDGSGLGVGPADEGFHGRTQDLLTTFGGLRRGEQLLLGVGLQPLEQVAFEFRVAGLGGGMGFVPDGQFFLGQRLIVALDDRGFEAQFEVLVERRVEA